MIDNIHIDVEGLISYWTRRLIPKVKIKITQDRRNNCHMWVSKLADNTFHLTYHPERIKEWDYPLLVSGVLHEIGHIKKGWVGNGNRFLENLSDEIIAEKYALKIMKKYYPEMVPAVIKKVKQDMRDPKWTYKYKIYFHAFSHIKEYCL